MPIPTGSAMAPGKIILSGEHSVVYGAPALAVAVAKYARVEIQPLESPDQEISLHLQDIPYRGTKAFDEIAWLKKKLDKEYEKGKSRLHSLLSDEPGNLYFYAIARFLEYFDLASSAFTVRLVSEISPGSGMGSSSATLVALHLAMHDYFSIQVRQDRLVEMSAHAERLQHSCISRIDSNVVSQGGLVYLNEGRVKPLGDRMPGQWYLIHTGKPAATTGECVSQVRKEFGQSDIWSEFARLTCELERAFFRKDVMAIGECMRQNQLLLERIGVVPEKVSKFCHFLYENHDIMAKVSGAGSISGDYAGLLVAFAGNRSSGQLQMICHDQGYPCYSLVPDRDGARCHD